MSDIDNLAKRALGLPPEDPDARERARAILREHIAAEPNRARGGALGVRRSLAFIGAVVVLALVATAAPWGASRAVAAALHDLRDRAIARPALVLAAGEVLRTQTQTFYEDRRQDLETGETYAIEIRSEIETTIHPDGSESRVETIQSVSFPTPADDAVWRAQGSPELPQPGDVRTDQLSPRESQWFSSEALSEDAAATLAALRAGEVAPLAPGDDQTFLLIADLLADPRLTTAQRVALFDAAAQLEGIQVLGEREDPLGRTGQAFESDEGTRRAIIFFDETTGLPLATELYDIRGTSERMIGWKAFNQATLASSDMPS